MGKKISAANKAKKLTHDKSKCACGCGEVLRNPKRRFNQGHSQYIEPSVWKRLDRQRNSPARNRPSSNSPTLVYRADGSKKIYQQKQYRSDSGRSTRGNYATTTS